MANPFVFILIILLHNLTSCTKDKVPSQIVVQPTKWELISGDYKVYDTTGVYLYDMSISHFYNESYNQDSLIFENFDGEFSFSTIQMNPAPSNFPNVVTIGSHDTLYGAQMKRWKIGSGVSEAYNQLINDTIKLRFQKTNINYYIQDLTPYYSCDCKQIAVKQN